MRNTTRITHGTGRTAREAFGTYLRFHLDTRHLWSEEI